ncbi:hypothetical protein [Vibrio sp. Isolate24]|uniref:hypothetical protein n=1 Tax=Vibrio sp. Isolate24 TaxID=2908534 RepID=UPI001EFECEAD|nr:hypothetical protein [Vibrio sp. Isolate24]MCG9677463.1 hypothetical protein [Vibrio sp. Isolate24]
MKTLIGISNFSFESQRFISFGEIKDEFAKLKSLQGKFSQDGVSLSIATDILKDQYFGHSIETQFNNFTYGKDKQAITAFRMTLERGYFSGFEKRYTSDELKKLAKSPDENRRLCCTLYAPKTLIAGLSSIKSIGCFDSYYEQILGSYPIDEDSYYQRATSHFKNIIYHVDCKDTLKRVPDGFCNYSVAITKCLKALDSLSPVSGVNIQNHLSDIATKAHYACTPEGKSHDHFKFDFQHGGVRYPKLGCQYHLKPSDRNTKGDGSHNHKRIYFGFIPLANNKLRIAVAAIGPHITTHDSSDRYAPEKTKRKKVRRRGNS